ncbi:MAG: AAA family ATPase [Chloroflexota bacterium]
MPIFQDHFIDNRNEWPLRDDTRMKQKLLGYHYILQRWSDVGHSLIWKDINIEPGAEYRVNTVIERRSGGNHGYGLIWRGKDKDNCYAFEISGTGYFKILQREEGTWKALINWTECGAIHQQNGTNELTVTQAETEAIFAINGIEVHRMPITIPAHNAGIGFIVNGQLRLEVDSILVTYYVERDDENGASKSKKTKQSSEEDLKEVMDELNQLIGMENIKREINTLINVLKVQKLRAERGMKTTDLSLHMVLAGPPGTGKTTVARLIGRIYAALGFLAEGHVIETDRAGLVAQYVGQTAPKVEEVVNEASGGILFIDEAYSLMPSDGGAGGRDFGQEAIEALLKRMEDKRGDFALVIAGYADEMHRFLDANPGVRSRFNRYLYFDHYTPDELTGIYELFANLGGFELDEGAKKAVQLHMAKAYARRDNAFGNGRYARNLFEDTIEQQANRIVGIDNALENGDAITDEDLKTFMADDIPSFKDDSPELTPAQVAELLNIQLEPPENKPETEIVEIKESEPELADDVETSQEAEG